MELGTVAFQKQGGDKRQNKGILRSMLSGNHTRATHLALIRIVSEKYCPLEGVTGLLI